MMAIPSFDPSLRDAAERVSDFARAENFGAVLSCLSRRAALPAPFSSLRGEELRIFEDEGGGDEHDFRLWHARSEHLPTELFRALTKVEAAAERVRGGEGEILPSALRLFSRLLEWKEVEWVEEASSGGVSEPPPLDAGCSFPSRAFLALSSSIEQGRAGEATKVSAFLRDRRASAKLLVVHRDWTKHDDTAFRHRTDAGTLLRWHAAALAGGSFELLVGGGDGEGWPWWVGKGLTALFTPPPPFLGPLHLPSSFAAEEGGGVVEHVEGAGAGLDKCSKRAFDHWSRSAGARDLLRFELLRSLVLAGGEDEGGRIDAFLTYRRARTEAERRGGFLSVMRSAFSAEYAEGAVQLAAEDERIACFVVEDSRAGGDAVAAVSMVLFEAAPYWGGKGAALLIDSFAVDKKWQGKGIGGKVFHHLCRPVAARRSRRYLVFAQCMNREKKAALFWAEKLDESSVARDALLQAYRMGHAAILASTCAAKGREYEG